MSAVAPLPGIEEHDLRDLRLAARRLGHQGRGIVALPAGRAGDADADALRIGLQFLGEILAGFDQQIRRDGEDDLSVTSTASGVTSEADLALAGDGIGDERQA
jgi:hypothetical protein